MFYLSLICAVFGAIFTVEVGSVSSYILLSARCLSASLLHSCTTRDKASAVNKLPHISKQVSAGGTLFRISKELNDMKGCFTRETIL